MNEWMKWMNEWMKWNEWMNEMNEWMNEMNEWMKEMNEWMNEMKWNERKGKERMKWMNEWMEWMNEWMKWMNEWMIEWMTDWLTDWMNEWIYIYLSLSIYIYINKYTHPNKQIDKYVMSSRDGGYPLVVGKIVYREAPLQVGSVESYPSGCHRSTLLLKTWFWSSGSWYPAVSHSRNEEKGHVGAWIRTQVLGYPLVI